MRNNLIPVFKPSNPDKVLYADQRQINEQRGGLVKVSEKAAWLKANAGAPTQAQKASAAEPAEAAPAKPTKAELLKLAEEKGIPVTRKMTVAQLEAALAA